MRPDNTLERAVFHQVDAPEEPLSVLRENVGTCTLKHALLKLAADEAGAGDVELRLGVFEMSGATTPGIGHILASHGLECVPEAHCYLAIDGEACIRELASRAGRTAMPSDLSDERPGASTGSRRRRRRISASTFEV